MKRLSTIIMALALVLGMSQCKKQETPTNGNGGEKVYVTLNVNNGESIAVNVDNGGRHAVAPNLGVIQFRDTDVLYVGHDGKYIGQLTYNNGAFSGELNAPTSADFLHFYFLGGKTPTTAPTAGTTTSFNISIADQSQNLPVLCYGHSSQPYTGSGSNYTATLEYKCALVKFNLNKATDYKCTLLNMPTEATISFATTSSNFTPIAKTSTTGSIDLYREEGNTGVRWAILLKGTNLSADGNVSGAPSGTLNENQFINSGITLTNPVFAAPDPANAVKDKNSKMSVFSVGNGKKVYFSRANLKCNTADNNALVWSFHENQYDECYGTKTGSTSAPADQGASVNMTNSSEMDRFSWGLHGSTTTGESDWVDGSRNLNDYDETDWGCALKGTTYGDHWRTLTADEWNYLLNNTDRGSRRFLKACIKIAIPKSSGSGYYTTYINGLFIAPDNFDPSVYGYTPGTATGVNAFVANNQWNNPNTVVNLIDGFMQMGGTKNYIAQNLFYAGCVFLPGVGYRTSSFYINYFYYNSSGVFEGYYWSATGEPVTAGIASTPYAHALKFTNDAITYPFSETRDRGMCVRLVWDAN